MTTAPAVWYLMRATGVVALLLLTLSFGLGIATSNRWYPRGSRQWVTTTLHRNASLLSVVFLAIHVVTSIIDPDAQVRALAAFWPFGTAWWLATGTLSLDLLAAVVVTGLTRNRLPMRFWKAVHWSAYAAWPLAVVHTLGMGTDAHAWWLAAVTIACIAAIGGLVTWRLTEPAARAA
jgi:methionine sulfoxide reductase heme-binding subunit